MRSVNGPEFTVINGLGAARVPLLTNDAILSGFTLTNGVAAMACDGGGGILRIHQRRAVQLRAERQLAGYVGGGAYGGTLNNCTLTGNSAIAAAGRVAARSTTAR